MFWFVYLSLCSASKTASLPTAQGREGSLAAPSTGESGTLRVTTKRRRSRGKVDKDWEGWLMAVMSPACLLTPQCPRLLAALRDLDKGSAKGLGGGSGVGPKLFQLRCELPRSRACGICLSAPTWHHVFHRADTPYVVFAGKKEMKPR